MPAMAIVRIRLTWRLSRSRRAMCFFVTILGGVDLGFAIQFLHDAKTGHGAIKVARAMPRECVPGGLAYIFQVSSCEGKQGYDAPASLPQLQRASVLRRRRSGGVGGSCRLQ